MCYIPFCLITSSYFTILLTCEYLDQCFLNFFKITELQTIIFFYAEPLRKLSSKKECTQNMAITIAIYKYSQYTKILNTVKYN
jgi:hypothetical protein